MLKQDQLKKLGRIYTCLYFEEHVLTLDGRKVINIRVKKWHPFEGDIFDEDGSLFENKLAKIDLNTAKAAVLYEQEYYKEDVYDENDNLIKEGERIEDEYEIMQLDQERF